MGNFDHQFPHLSDRSTLDFRVAFLAQKGMYVFETKSQRPVLCSEKENKEIVYARKV